MAFLVTKAGGAGLTYRQTRHPQFRRLTRGVRTTTDEWLEDVRGFSLILPPDAVFSHTTAAHIQNLPIPTQNTHPLHVTTPVGGPRVRRNGLKGHHRHLPPQDRDRWHALPVTTPIRTLRDLAGGLTVEDLVVIADHLLHSGLCTQAELHDTHGRRHAQLLRQVARLADARSYSPEETRLRLTLLKAGLPIPTLNEDIIEDGIWIGRGDLVWRQWRTIADYDGDHHKTPDQRHQDSQTRDDYAATGWRHIVITNKMADHDRIQRVARALTAHGWHGHISGHQGPHTHPK